MRFQSPNNRSKPFILFSILICAWRPNFTFFGIFYYLLSHFENRRSGGPEIFTVFTVHPDFQSVLINSKKIPKNVKLGLQAHINMENKMNGLDQSFGLWISDLWSNAQWYLCIAMHHSPSPIIYIKNWRSSNLTI